MDRRYGSATLTESTIVNSYITQFTIDVLHFDQLRKLAPELPFLTLGQAEIDGADGPYIYVLVEPRGGVIYVGKSDAKNAAAGRRALSYAKWSSQYLESVSRSGGPDPMVDPQHGDRDLTDWSPIVRFITRHQASVYMASVRGLNAEAREWEARLQALAGYLTALESVVGGSGWEAKPGTLRGAGYLWAAERIKQVNQSGFASLPRPLDPWTGLPEGDETRGLTVSPAQG